ncbi:M10 family metallopeptidase C-terminal domain-containing protein [Shimia biformata]|uniref:M10 family metallopeptidase C-terminal domain-containing protein n=1 Tax=Shimia biformata TaxID=1294299 RepID=UPI0019507810|nr:M10 family metallopeptidase C-terminal domain-containing protein [Shimia biformata]
MTAKSSPDGFNPTSSALLGADIAESGDAAASTATTASVSVDDTFLGTIGSGSDQDWIAVELTAGEDYVFWVRGVNGYFDGLSDTTLAVHNSSGTQLAFNDDVEINNLFSLVEFTAPTTGTYYLNVGSFGTNTGDYALEVSTSTFSVDQIATYMTEFGWGYSVPIHFDAGPGDTLTYNISGLTSDGQALAEWALETWGTALGITFRRTSSSSADIVFDDSQPGAFAGPSSFNPVDGINAASTVNISTTWISAYGSTIDSYSFQTFLHEIGHALGIGHAGPYDGSATFGVDNVYVNDSTQMTLMSYFSVAENPNVSGDDVTVVSPMSADIAAIAALYGAASVYGGNTVWGAHSNVGGWLEDVMNELFLGIDTAIYDGGPIGFTIYDTGGIDTLNLETATTAQVIDLAPGTILNLAGLAGNVVIDANTVIENLKGGGADDILTGNGAANQILGGNGNDVIRGNAKADILMGEAGNDQLFGGTGGDELSGGGGRDKLYGHGGADELQGDAQGDLLLGGGGKDILEGGTGHDRLNGGAGKDTLIGGAGKDRLLGHAGDDILTGDAGADQFRFLLKKGEIGHDTVTDFELGHDMLELDAGLWSGALTAVEVVTQFASVIGGDVVFDFGGSDSITLEGLTSTADLADDIALV